MLYIDVFTFGWNLSNDTIITNCPRIPYFLIQGGKLIFENIWYSSYGPVCCPRQSNVRSNHQRYLKGHFSLLLCPKTQGISNNTQQQPTLWLHDLCLEILHVHGCACFGPRYSPYPSSSDDIVALETFLTSLINNDRFPIIYICRI